MVAGRVAARLKLSQKKNPGEPPGFSFQKYLVKVYRVLTQPWAAFDHSYW